MTPGVAPAPQRHAAPNGWSDPEMLRLADIAREAAGLVFSTNRIPSAEQGIHRAMKAVQIGDLAEFRRAVEQSTGGAREALLAELTIGESYFFREPAQLEFITRELLPEIARQRTATETAAPVRMWSAGCSNGEEPYSLAMLLREAAWRHGSEILGTDISIPRLATAQRGRYSEWAMRATPRPLIERWFEQSGKSYMIRPEIREMVQFRPMNLVSDSELPAAGSTGMDLILCRNVLIYFSMETVAKVATRLLASLAPDGWLIISASDPPLTDIVECETVTTTAGLAYRRKDRPGYRAPRTRAPSWPADPSPDVPPLGTTEYPAGTPPTRPLGTPPAPAAAPVVAPRVAPPRRAESAPAVEPVTVEAVYAAGDFDRAAALAATRIAAGRDDERTRILHVRALANRGRIDEASAACDAALDQFPLSPELHLLHATLLARAGQFGRTIVAARRALYLDPSLVMGHIVSADAHVRTGDLRSAERALRAAAEILDGLAADAPVAAADGETAGRLQQIVAFQLKALAAKGGQ